ncbi:protein-L-isoaspartate O-methyltransferase [Undibacterium sp. LX40W]|uniref:Protein-L-isoaspartate O-methyltransferase n=1 Tax=Undibacterium nitidum TaxID=2762298 RepID=A0A923KTA8_9BURK|nr:MULTISPECIES: protein-L-isoaspartate O-methyltransferase [Undibacterium]MBC3882076.1 protein-L-isoaspartate O-methyltransferase [Undibacterium nitidum]MBC3892357.1 protein-L-isoaspartate O-methyltransferase [Undibacterium sp. LX40W]
MNIEQARFNMIEQQIRPTNVSSPEVLSLLATVKRENFFPDSQKALAFFDTSLPLVAGVMSLPPKLEARIIQEVNAKSTDSVLVVGADSGYLAALLAHQARHVTVMEAESELRNLAQANIKANGLTNVEVVLGDALQNQAVASFDVIVVTGSLESIPQNLQEQLNVGGRLFVFVGKPPVMSAQLITRESDLFFKAQDLFETSVGRLSQAIAESSFRL